MGHTQILQSVGVVGHSSLDNSCGEGNVFNSRRFNFRGMAID